MVDAARLQAEAEQAEISGEMARSRSLIAKASVRERGIKWLGAKTRLLAAAKDAGDAEPDALERSADVAEEDAG